MDKNSGDDRNTGFDEQGLHLWARQKRRPRLCGLQTFGEIKMIITVLQLSMFFALGVITRIAGLDLSRWETWAILTVASVIGVVSYYEGRESK